MDSYFVIRKVAFLYKRQGIMGPIRALGRKFYYYCIRVPGGVFSYLWFRVAVRSRFPTFVFQGNTYRYLTDFQNFSWITERSVEAPIGTGYLREAYDGKKRVLEIGDTLRQYSGLGTHDIVDKYEYRRDLINEDILDFKPTGKYDLIISISTMEHVGWDLPDERDPEKLPRALALFKKWLAPGGKVVITMPMGWNSEVDRRLKAHAYPFTRTHYMKQVARGVWREAEEKDALAQRYNTPFLAANAIVVGIIE